MASEKMINGRLQLKHDIEANWNLAAEKSNFTPKIAEPIVYDADETYDYIRFKIGDGARNVKDLPFIDDMVWNQFQMLDSLSASDDGEGNITLTLTPLPSTEGVKY